MAEVALLERTRTVGQSGEESSAVTEVEPMNQQAIEIVLVAA